MSALTAHRRRLAERGLKRIEVRATPADAERLKAIAKILARDDAAARALRAKLDEALPARERDPFLEALLAIPESEDFSDIMEQVVAERRSHRTRDVKF